MGSSSPSWLMIHIIEDSLIPLRDFDEFKISNIYHEGNKVVDNLANIGVSFPSRKVWNI